ncbi:Rieske 2Fe-2S domain-containing protein [Sphingomonas crocodyli]|uniref:cholesterol 7-desaturase n=1 Tax=Sphingomonas crocodyli TaxID=1979270 RepID=A0A437M082_9SPHN|nr:Rieske 2Fe-2S domain-containing protein [Sphingomonas crocodyli]RVT91032.1 Rieske (2Fe-2S) protein [Sphingomonas crocodyli]
MDQGKAPQDTRTEKSATWERLKLLSKEEREAWRLEPAVERRDPDARNLPDEFPFGWFGIMWSDELAVGEIKSVRYFAKDMVLWRGEDGAARLIDAYCPHYGAHLGSGEVAGNLIQCPFHAWRLDGNGAVKEIPYARNIPPQAKRDNCVPSYKVEEANGYIYMWYHPEGVAPMWEMRRIEEFGHPDWTGFTKAKWHIYAAMDNVSDNGVDIAHFRYVHRTQNVPEYEFGYDGIKRWSIARAKLGTPMGTIDGKISASAMGMGQGVTRFEGISDTIMIPAIVPIERDKVQYLYGFIQPKAEAEGPKGGLARAIIKDICWQFDEDKVILDGYRRLARPLVCDGDGPFGRNWQFTDQFYLSRAKKPDPTKLAAE